MELLQKLQNLFAKLTYGQEAFIDWDGYKTAEIQFPGMLRNIGIGINDDESAIKLFYIDESHPRGDQKRFKQTYRIDIKNNLIGIELPQGQLVGDIYFVNYHMQIAHMIINELNWPR